MDYAELVRLLRKNNHPNGLKAQAADVIEELLEDNAALNGTVTNLLESIAALGKPRWIPVTERLPEENDDVLIYGEWMGTKYREIWLTDLKGFLYQGYKPIAWMPLPEPPKEETE